MVNFEAARWSFFLDNNNPGDLQTHTCTYEPNYIIQAELQPAATATTTATLCNSCEPLLYFSSVLMRQI